MTGADNGSNDRRDEYTRGVVSLAVSPDGQCYATAADICSVVCRDESSHNDTRHAGEISSLEFMYIS